MPARGLGKPLALSIVSLFSLGGGLWMVEPQTMMSAVRIETGTEALIQIGIIVSFFLISIPASFIAERMAAVSSVPFTLVLAGGCLFPVIGNSVGLGHLPWFLGWPTALALSFLGQWMGLGLGRLLFPWLRRKAIRQEMSAPTREPLD